MPTKIEKDSVTGRETTGHEWDGIRELNTPLPKWWLYTFYASIAFAIGLCIIYPSFPYGAGYFHGTMGFSQRRAVDADVARQAVGRQAAMDKIAALSFDDIRKDPALMAVALADGRLVFAENCQPCHGAGGGGRPGYPALAAGDWLWGGKLSDIQQTVTHGIRSGDPDARQSAMPKFGADGILKPDEIQNIADYVWSQFYHHPSDSPTIAAGAALFAANCAVCHGAAGQGGRDVGAPRLASYVHLYGDSRDTIVAQITQPHQGVMPNWNTRLDPATIKAVALYVHDFGGGE